MTNTADTFALRVLSQFSAAVTPGYGAVDATIAATPRTRIDSLRRSLPALERYAFAINQIYRAARPQPSALAGAAIDGSRRKR